VRLAGSTITLIDAAKAEQIALQFLKQHYSVKMIEKSILKDGSWMVEALVSSFDNTKKITVEIRALTGSIQSWY
jgi:hypothetical protein